MAQRSRLLATLAALNGFLAVAFGAFGAHALQDPQAQEWVRTAMGIQLPHAAAVLAVLAFRPDWRVAPWLLAIGSLLFASALQALALGAPRMVATAAPAGGALMLAGWAIVGLRAMQGGPR